MLTDKELHQLKQRYFAAAVERTTIPLEYYELPPEVIEQAEKDKSQAARHKKESKARLCPSRGEVSLARKTRRSVGDFSLLDEDDGRDHI